MGICDNVAVRTYRIFYHDLVVRNVKRTQEDSDVTGDRATNDFYPVDVHYHGIFLVSRLGLAPVG